jgi:hypothetical protein
MESGRAGAARVLRDVVVIGLIATAAVLGVAAGSAGAAKKLKACTVVPQADLEAAVGNAFDPPQDSSLGSLETSCRFASADLAGSDLNLFLATDVKGGVKNAPGGAFFATKKSFQKVYGSATPVSGIGKQAFTSFDSSSSIPQGSLLVLDGKNHAALIVLTGSGITDENTVEKGKAVAALVLPKLQ